MGVSSSSLTGLTNDAAMHRSVSRILFHWISLYRAVNIASSADNLMTFIFTIRRRSQDSDKSEKICVIYTER
jgi:hypothetical protein